MKTRSDRPRLDGVVLIDKPEGPTSHDVVQRVRRTIGQSRVGHCGTLDPFATGLLVVCLGRATRLVSLLGAGVKLYEGTVLLGRSTDTDDITGRTVREENVDLTDAEIDRALGALRGVQEQIPPAFSAKRTGGVRAHRRARRGDAVRLTPARVEIHEIRLIGRDGRRVSLALRVSRGTYIRALARDLGERLGCGGCLETLRRLASAPFSVDEAVPPDVARERLVERMIPLDRVPLGLPSLAVSGEQAGWLRCGRAVPLGAESPREGDLRLLDPQGRLVGIGRIADKDGEISVHPRVVFTVPESP